MSAARRFKDDTLRLRTKVVVGRALTRYFRTSIRITTPPSVAELAHTADGITTAQELFAGGLDAIGHTVGPERLGELAAEYAQVSAEIARRYRTMQIPYPTDWAIEEATARLLYYLVRIARPETVLEIGVANGHSTAIILDALRRNATGRLHSVDIRSKVGALLGEADRTEWTYVELAAKRANAELIELMNQLPPLDLAFHDGSHEYIDQLLDYEAIWPRLRTGGVLVSDDIDLSRAFSDFVQSVGARPVILLDRRKVVGIQLKNE